MPQRTKKRKLVDARIKFISLCRRGANQLDVIYKSDDSFQFDPVLKAAEGFDEKGELLGVVYRPDAADADGDFADEPTIRKMAHTALRDGIDIDFNHNEQSFGKDDIYVAESFIVGKGDERFAKWTETDGTPVDVTGAWGVVIKIENENLRQLYRDGAFNGISMGGEGHFAPVGKAATEPDHQGETMDETQFKALMDGITKSNDETQEAIEGISGRIEALEKRNQEADDKAAAEAKKAEELAKSKAECPFEKPAIPADPTDREALAKYQKDLAHYNVAKDVDWNDADAVAKFLDETQEKKTQRKAAQSNAGSAENFGKHDDEGEAPEQVAKSLLDCLPASHKRGGSK